MTNRVQDGDWRPSHAPSQSHPTSHAHPAHSGQLGKKPRRRYSESEEYDDSDTDSERGEVMRCTVLLVHRVLYWLYNCSRPVLSRVTSWTRSGSTLSATGLSSTYEERGSIRDKLQPRNFFNYSQDRTCPHFHLYMFYRNLKFISLQIVFTIC